MQPSINLMLGDCLERMKEIPDGSVDMVLTDPPYGVNYQSNRGTKTEKFNKIELDENYFNIASERTKKSYVSVH